MPGTTPSAESLEQLTAESGVYRLLSRLWLGEVDHTLLGELRKPPLCDALPQAGGILPEGNSQAVIDTLSADYCQLFLGPKDHLPAFQSVWQEGHFQGQASTSMKLFVEATGYQPAQLAESVMLDHLGVQLDLMGRLLDQSTTIPHDSQQRELWLQLVKKYFVSHLMWTDDLLALAAEHASTQFYRSIVQLTQDFLLCQGEIWAGDTAV